jgi:DNA helicase-2/ATP-dependent DNA helicase PcrA
VGMTRARRKLYFTYARARLLNGHTLIGHVSRFVGEIGQIHLRFEHSQDNACQRRLTSARPGDRVVHPRWREGTVTAIQGRGKDALITVVFDMVGTRRMLLWHAPLTTQVG